MHTYTYTYSYMRKPFAPCLGRRTESDSAGLFLLLLPSLLLPAYAAAARCPGLRRLLYFSGNEHPAGARGTRGLARTWNAGRRGRGMGSLLCCLQYPEDGSAAPPECCFCLPWPFPYHGVDSGSAARHRGDTRVAPDRARIPLAACTSAGQVDSMDTFCAPPRPLPYDDPRFSPRMAQHPTVSGHDKASTHIQKPQPAESKSADKGSTCSAHKVSGSPAKQHSEGSRIDGIQFCDSSDNEDDCPVCLEEYDFENPKIALQCNHNFHLSCIYEWMERSQACPVCAKIMLFNEDE